MEVAKKDLASVVAANSALKDVDGGKKGVEENGDDEVIAANGGVEGEGDKALAFLDWYLVL